MENKITKVVALNYALDNFEMPNEIRQKFVDMRDSFIEVSMNRKPTAKQNENIEYKATLLDMLTFATEPMSIPMIMASNESFAKLSNQRISALLTQLIKDGRIVREEIKRKAYFRAV